MFSTVLILHLLLIHLPQDLLDAVGKPAKRPSSPSPQARYGSSHKSSVFSHSPPVRCSSLLLLLAPFGAAVRAMGPATATATVNQLYPLPLTGSLRLSASTYLGSLSFYSVIKLSAYNPLMINFQVSSGIQNDSCLIHYN